GSPVVFLHGVGSDRSVWREQLDRFGEYHRALALDFRGHGESDVPPLGSIDRAAFAADVAAAVGELQLGPVHLVGLSMGGVVALETYSRFPELVRTLTLADSFARFPAGRRGWRPASGSWNTPQCANWPRRAFRRA
ncbi:MAG: alpha/beta fold hydrolase, partial [Chloroflexia bacterium]